MAHRTFARSVAVVAAAALTLVVSPGVSSAMMIRNADSGADIGEKPPASEAEEPRPKPPQKHKPAPLQGEKPTPPTPSPTPEKDKPEPGGDNDGDNHDNDGDDGDGGVVGDGDEPATSTGERIVDLAARHAGAPYVYGADGPDQFDCSGLTQYVHARLGIDLPRTSRDQRAALPELPKSEMRPGDLLFFAQNGHVYHVGIYAGNGRMWAAPEPGDVVRLQDIWTQSFTVGRAW
ncbi:C40 family peptidase [Saccharomonospora azurea]|uniref:C40 family peptidase n=1 Tax=Saccharomonospora azurea TaxID=40988 RepID=UPI003D8C0175